MRVLVVAPRFPSLNQPWIDTYLAGLTRRQVEFVVATATDVDERSTEPRLLRIPGSRSELVRTWLLASARHPVRALANGLRALATLRGTGEGSRGNLAWLSYLLARRWELPKIDLVHAHEEIAGYHFLLFALAIDRPFVLTFHGLPPKGVGQLSTDKRRLLYDRCAAVFVNTEFAKRQVVSLGCAASKVIVLPQGLPLEGFRFTPKPCPQSEPVQLLTVGRFHEDKGHAYALLACARLGQRGIGVRYRIIGVGSAADRARLTRLIERLGLADRVSIQEGASSAEVRAAYREAHVFILPSVRSKDSSHEETQGVVLQEAQASGCIPVTTRTGGIPECVNDGRDAVLVQDRSSRGIADAISWLVDNPSRWEGFQRNGRENVERHFEAGAIADRMAGHLTAIVAPGLPERRPYLSAASPS